jgi:hypothetical protein
VAGVAAVDGRAPTRAARAPGQNADRLPPYSALVLDGLDHVLAGEQQGRPTPHPARLSAEAAEARVALSNLLQDRMTDGGN